MVQVISQVVTSIASIFIPGLGNAAPTAGSPTVGTPDPATGVVSGSISATDPDGEAVTFSAPAVTAKGAVVLDSVTGDFTYTPTAAARHAAARDGAAATDRNDTFTVTVTDERGAVSTVNVSVAVSPANTAPIAGTTSVGTPDASTGVVNGSVAASDADGDALSFSGSVSTAKGAVLVNPDGSFTYTPTQSARHAAAREGADPRRRPSTSTGPEPVSIKKVPGA